MKAQLQTITGFSQETKTMKSDEKMFSFGEIIQSKEFEREAPEGFAFNIRRVLRDKEREQSQPTQKVINKKKISGLAK